MDSNAIHVNEKSLKYWCMISHLFRYKYLRPFETHVFDNVHMYKLVITGRGFQHSCMHYYQHKMRPHTLPKSMYICMLKSEHFSLTRVSETLLQVGENSN